MAPITHLSFSADRKRLDRHAKIFPPFFILITPLKPTIDSSKCLHTAVGLLGLTILNQIVCECVYDYVAVYVCVSVCMIMLLCMCV